jgi:hypothetical protein
MTVPVEEVVCVEVGVVCGSIIKLQARTVSAQASQ